MSEEKGCKEMYPTMVRATERAVQTLIAAQRKCEEMYLAETGPDTEAPDPEREDV